jgi:uncharacterized short protein YbdD (DUF466 family)
MRRRANRATTLLSFALQRAWSVLRQLSGDAAYDNYLRSLARLRAAGGHGCGVPLTREEFYLDALRRRYSGASRCC